MASAARAASLLSLSTALCMAVAPAAAQVEPVPADAVVAAVDTAVEVELWPATAVSTLPRYAGDASPGEVVDYRLWLGAGRAAFGFGVAGAAPARDFAAGPWVARSGSTAAVVGMRYQLSESSRVYFDSASLAQLPARDLRMGFEFKSAPSTALGLARGTLFRVQWNSYSHLSLRVRGGGLTVALRAQF